MNNNSFFTSENKDILYNLIRDELYKETDYNIDDNKKYYNTFGQIMKIVYKHSDDKNNLTILNKSVLGKTIPYLQKEIEKKNLVNKPLLPKDYKNRKMPSQYENLLERDVNNKSELPLSFRSTPVQYNDNSDINASYDDILKNREIKMDKPKEINFNDDKNNNNVNPVDLMNKNMEERKNIILNDENYEITNLKLNNNVSNDLYDSNIQHDTNTNLDLNIDENINPLELFEKQNKLRENQNNEYKNLQNNKNSFEDNNKIQNENINEFFVNKINKKNEDEEKKFTDSLSYKLNRQMNDININELQGQLDNRIENISKPKNPPVADDKIQLNELKEDMKLFNKFKETIFKEKKYINRENLICINSGDRDWLNELNEHRYSFQIRFKPERDSFQRVPKMVDGNIQRNSVTKEIIYENKLFKGDQGCGIETIYKNIVSFELVRVLMPIENFIIPYDNRIFIDYKSLPYIVLNIEEIEGLYSGTNSNIQGSFAKLLWDKDHNTDIITDTSLLQNNKKDFSRHIKRGFSSMAPMSFEKKTFYPSPLASLNRLTLSLNTPYGSNIKNHSDVLNIKTISLLDIQKTAILSMTEPNGFPYSANNNIIQIVTQTFFNNRVFRIGDNIKIGGFETLHADTNLSNDFINRLDGHYIINLEKETSAQNDAAKNEGYINKLYIAGPGKYTDSTTTNNIITNTTSLSSLETITGLIVNNNGTNTDVTCNIDPTNLLNVGDAVKIEGQDKTVTAVASNKFVVNSNFSGSVSNKSVERYRKELYKDFSGNNTCKLINKSIQTHFVFKIITREEDITSIMNTSNI